MRPSFQSVIFVITISCLWVIVIFQQPLPKDNKFIFKNLKNSHQKHQVSERFDEEFQTEGSKVKVLLKGVDPLSLVLVSIKYVHVDVYPLSYGVPVRERYGSTLLPATREQHGQNCTQSY